MQSVVQRTSKGKQKAPKKVVKTKAPSKPAKAKKQIKNKHAIATTIKHGAYKIDD